MKPWEAKWKVIRELGAGGQGFTFLVQSTLTGQSGALKILKNQKDPERRKRLHREAAILETLDHRRIPKILDSNGEQFAALDIPLFLVAEFIPGSPLSKASSGPPFDLELSSEHLFGLLEALEYCHSQDVVHRDIKPDNIILRDDQIMEPVLIDFGLSFNDDEQHGDSTPTLQQLGNRFLALPELQAHSEMKRDPRSDITCCCGVFFYLLTGQQPTTLLDHQNRLPHQRPGAVERIAQLEETSPIPLRRVFDTAFPISIDHRYQSITALRNAMWRKKGYDSQSQTPEDLNQKLIELNERVRNTPAFAAQNRLEELFHKTDQMLGNVASNLKRNVQDVAEFFVTGFLLDMRRLLYQNTLGFDEKHGERRQFAATISATATGTEFLIAVSENNDETELYRGPLVVEPDWNEINESMRAYYINGMASRFA